MPGPNQTVLALALFAFSAMPLAVAAQDGVAQLRAAESAFYPTGSYSEPVALRFETEAVLQQLAGTWLSASALLSETDADLSDIIVRVCDRQQLRSEVVLTAPYSFDIVRRTDAGDRPVEFATSYTLTQFNIFNRTSDDRDFLTYLGMLDPETGLPRGESGQTMVEQLLLSSAYTRFGPVALFHPSPDVFILQPFSAPIEIYLRCPT